MIILLLGPDGVGKTTVGKKLAERNGWSYVYGGARNPSTKLLKMRQKKAEKTTSVKKWPFLRKKISILLLIVDGLMKIQKLKASSEMCVMDRSVIDVFVQNEMKVPCFIAKILRKNVVACFLEAKPKVIFLRKQELDLEEIDRQLKAYGVARSQFPGFVVSADEPADDVVMSIEISLASILKVKRL